ncbi:MAG: hypothetical protein ACOCWH_01355 [Spirochaetota bacterium]
MSEDQTKKKKNKEEEEEDKCRKPFNPEAQRPADDDDACEEPVTGE